MRLFEIEIPEVYDGIIEIKRIAREPGDRAKVAVLSHDERIDAVGACVGMKGVRIHAIVRELNNENIDVINYTDDPAAFIQRALAPAKLKNIQVDVENKKATILVANDQVSLAIGKGGQNVRLASRLTGFELTVQKEGGEEEEYDMDLSEFREELGDVLFHKFFDENYESVRDVIQTSKEELVNTLGIEPEKVEEILIMLKKGLEEAEVENEEETDELLAEIEKNQNIEKSVPEEAPSGANTNEIIENNSTEQKPESK
jgi:N utilization substance protein A